MRLLLLAVIVTVGALLVPGLATADPAAVADEVVTTAPAAPADAAEPPATPVDEAPATPVEEQPTTEAPTSEAPAPPPATGETPPPTETESTPTPAPAPAIVEAAPPPASALPTTPDAPKPVVEPDKLPVALLPVVRTAPTAVTVATAVVADVNASVPDAPSVVVKAVAADTAPPPLAPRVERTTTLRQEIFTLNPEQSRSPVAPVGATTIERGPGMPFGEESGSAIFSESVAAPIGAVGSGSSLLAVLAGYVLPGVGGPPASTLVMFILVGLIVAIARAPRPQLSERAHDGTLLGAACGHGLAVCRPG